jgi:hypothetical protein
MPPTPTSPTGEHLADREFVLTKCDYFVDVQVWPRATAVSPLPWLANFTEAELPYAIHLLDAFLFFSDELTDALLRGAFDDLSRRVTDLDASLARSEAQWDDFLSSVLITFPTGEHPNVTDSGLAFARKARQVLEIPEARIMSPEEVLGFVDRVGPRPVVFLDDFLGTGNQFMATWRRTYATSPTFASFADAAAGGSVTVYYTPILASQMGVETIRLNAPRACVAPAHILPLEYSALHDESLLWPPAERDAARAAIRSASARAGIPDTNGYSPHDWQGFGRLGLAVAFEHGVPDASLPLFYWNQNGWHPLVRRT